MADEKQQSAQKEESAPPRGPSLVRSPLRGEVTRRGLLGMFGSTVTQTESWSVMRMGEKKPKAPPADEPDSK